MCTPREKKNNTSSSWESSPRSPLCWEAEAQETGGIDAVPPQRVYFGTRPHNWKPYGALSWVLQQYSSLQFHVHHLQWKANGRITILKKWGKYHIWFLWMLHIVHTTFWHMAPLHWGRKHPDVVHIRKIFLMWATYGAPKLWHISWCGALSSTTTLQYFQVQC